MLRTMGKLSGSINFPYLQARSVADPPAGLPKVMLHAAVRSIGGAPGSDNGGSHPHTPQVVENGIAGDLMVAQVSSSSLICRWPLSGGVCIQSDFAARIRGIVRPWLRPSC